MTDELLQLALQNKQGQQQASAIDPLLQAALDKKAPKQKPGPVGNAGGQLLKGATWGFSDELGGVGAQLGKFAATGEWDSELYGRKRDEIRQKNRAYEEANPWSSFGLQMAGTLPGGIYSGSKFLGSKLAQSLSRPVQNIAMGAAGGSVAGAGLSEGKTPGEVATDTAQGAGVGGAVGLVAPWAMDKVGAGVGYVSSAVRDAFANPQNRAHRVMRQYLKDAGIETPQQAAKAVEGVDKPLVADISESTRQLTDTMANQPGPGRDIIKPELEARRAQSSKNVVDALEKTTGQKAGYYESVDAVEAKMKEMAAPLYKEAYETNVPFTSNLKEIFNRPVIKSAFKEMQEISGISGEQLPELFKYNNKTGEWVSTGEIPDAQGWDMIKRGLDSMIDGQTDAVTGKVSKKGQELIKLKNKMLDEIDSVNPAYAQARGVWAGGSSFKNAMKQGQKVLRTDDYLSAKDFAKMSDADKQGYLLGAMNAIRDKIEMIPQRHDLSLRQMFTAPAMQRRLEKAFPNKDAYNEFMRIVKSEGHKAETNKIIYGSQTATRGQHADRVGLDTAGDVVGASHGNIWNMLNLGRSALDKMQKLPPETQAEISRMLMGPVANMPNSMFAAQQMPRYLQYLTSPQGQQTVRGGIEGLLSYGSGSYAAK